MVILLNGKTERTNKMAGIIYTLCAVTAIICAYLLLRGYYRKRSRLLLWSGLCFAGLAFNNILLVVDELLLPSIDLSIIRMFPALIGLGLLIWGLIWESE